MATTTQGRVPVWLGGVNGNADVRYGDLEYRVRAVDDRWVVDITVPASAFIPSAAPSDRVTVHTTTGYRKEEHALTTAKAWVRNVADRPEPADEVPASRRYYNDPMAQGRIANGELPDTPRGRHLATVR